MTILLAYLSVWISAVTNGKQLRARAIVGSFPYQDNCIEDNRGRPYAAIADNLDTKMQTPHRWCSRIHRKCNRDLIRPPATGSGSKVIRQERTSRKLDVSIAG